MLECIDAEDGEVFDELELVVIRVMVEELLDVVALDVELHIDLIN